MALIYNEIDQNRPVLIAGQSKGKKAAQLGTWIALAVLGVLLLVCGGIGLNALFGGFCAALAAQGQTWAFFAAAGGLAFILALVLTFFYAHGVIFEAKDNELLLSMPIRPSAILASRIASVYFLNTLFSLLLLGAAGYTVSVRAGGLSALNVILLILCALLLPLLSTTLSCLLAWVVSIVTRHSRKKSLVQVLLNGEETWFSGLAPASGPYYDWTAMKSFLEKRMDLFRQR